jgi:hypothetical protein
MRLGHTAFLLRMFILTMTAACIDYHPAFPFEPFDYLRTPHVCIIHTIGNERQD